VVSFIFQNYNLIKNLNIFDNLVLPLRLTNKKIDYAKIQIYLSKFGIKSVLKSLINNLSGGEKQRVAITRAMLTNSKIILADEPSGALDSENSVKVMKCLEEISNRKLVIVVSHNEELAKIYATRIIRIKDGKIISDTNPCLDRYEFHNRKLKTKLRLKEKVKIALTNLKSKKTRNFLTTIAFSIGLFSLSLVLAISNGFSKELKNFEQNSLYSYPLIISKETISDSSSLFDSNNYDNNKINVNQSRQIVKNKFDDAFFENLDEIVKSDLGYVVYNHEIDDVFNDISVVNPTNDYFELIKGKMPQNENEVLLLLDYNNSVDEEVYEYLNIDDFNYDSVIQKEYNVLDKKIVISGIVKSNNEYFSSLNGILYNNDLFSSEIESVYIYPKNYKNKNKIKEVLNDCVVVDNAKEVVDLTSSLIDGISLVLIIFSVISLSVSCIMIAVMSYISIMERKNEIGIMQSLGTRNKDIKGLFLLENKLIALSSSLIALFLTFSFGFLFNNYIKKMIDINSLISLNWIHVFGILLLSVILSDLSGVIPIKALKRNSIIENIKST
jgi:ABC-type multidrug transport system ATPase subunit